MDRADLEHAVRVSARIERMTAYLFGRIDKFINFVQFVLGAAAFSPIASLHVIGILLVLMSTYSLVYQPGTKAALAEIQKRKYEMLCTKMGGMSDEELRIDHSEIQKDDSSEIEAICKISEYGEYMRVGAEPPMTLGFFDNVIGFLAGDRPKKY